MPGWKDLMLYLMDPTANPYTTLRELNVPAYRLRRMLRSKRLARRLALLQEVTRQRILHGEAFSSSSAIWHLANLATADRQETARRACLDMLEKMAQAPRQEQPWRPARPAGGPSQAGDGQAPAQPAPSSERGTGTPPAPTPAEAPPRQLPPAPAQPELAHVRP
jgi:hypothetical protein